MPAGLVIKPNVENELKREVYLVEKNIHALKFIHMKELQNILGRPTWQRSD